MLVFTLLSSWIGAGSLLAGAENAYRNGFVALWQPLGGWLGLILIALIAGRARHFAQFTVPDLLEARYNSTARVLGTIAIVISYVVITSYQFIGGGDILHLIFPQIARNTGLYIMAAFVIFFTAAAGMASIAYLDLVIGSMVTVTVIVAVPVLLGKVGGWSAVTTALPATHFQVLGNYTLAGAVALTLPTMLLLIGNQGMYQKFFSAKSEADARKSVIGWIIGTVTLETLLVTFAVIASSKLHTDRPREIIALTAKQILPPVAGRDTSRWSIREGHLHREQLPLLARHEPDSRCLRAVHRPQRQPAAHADRFAVTRYSSRFVRRLASDAIRICFESFPLCLYGLWSRRHSLSDGRLFLAAQHRRRRRNVNRPRDSDHRLLAIASTVRIRRHPIQYWECRCYLSRVTLVDYQFDRSKSPHARAHRGATFQADRRVK